MSMRHWHRFSSKPIASPSHEVLPPNGSPVQTRPVEEGGSVTSESSDGGIVASDGGAVRSGDGDGVGGVVGDLVGGVGGAVNLCVGGAVNLCVGGAVHQCVGGAVVVGGIVVGAGVVGASVVGAGVESVGGWVGLMGCGLSDVQPTNGASPLPAS